MHIIAVINQKGGVGKTVTTVNLAAALDEAGHDPLVIDYDPQMNATDWLMGREAEEDDATIFDALASWDGKESDRWPLSKISRSSESVGVPFVPSDSRMAAASFDSVVGRSPVFPQQFRCRVQELRTSQVRTNSNSDASYDFCLVDCPPSLGRSVATALAGADGIIVPIHTDRFSMRGVMQLQDTIKQIRKVHNDGLQILGLLLNNLDLRSNMVNEMREKFEEIYTDILFETFIPWRSKINEVATRGENIMEYEGASDAASFYLDLADEVVERSRTAATAR
ncbi:MAG: ParA family protein [Salinibacter sp.]|uniref:ParA family protein n=1 Tax=Salinibacter sp. TaxID=2065818 RepID=UPI0035D48EB1